VTRLLARRLVHAVPLLFFISALVFVLIHAAPGGPLAIYLSNPNVRPEDIERLLCRMIPLHRYLLARCARLGLQCDGEGGQPCAERRIDRVTFCALRVDDSRFLPFTLR
jgi:hypothetical protein